MKHLRYPYMVAVFSTAFVLSAAASFSRGALGSLASLVLLAQNDVDATTQRIVRERNRDEYVKVKVTP